MFPLFHYFQITTMKKIIPGLFIAVLFSACNGNAGDKKINKDSLYLDSVQKAIINNPGTTNFVDAKGLRQGKWMVIGKMQRDSVYAPDAKVEEGTYVDGQKDGEWMEYYPSGAVKSKGNYSGGKKTGKWAIYDQKGAETGEEIYN